jgi:hypothetical protein
MNQALKPRQLALVATFLLTLALLVGYRYFTAPSDNAASDNTGALRGTSVASLEIVLGPLAPRHLTVKNPDELLSQSTPDAWSMGGGISPQAPDTLSKEQRKRQDEQRAREKQAAQRKQKLFTDAVAYLRRAGITVTADKNAYVPQADENPLHVTILIQGNGMVIDGRPTWGQLGYHVELQRTAYLSKSAKNPAMVKLEMAMTSGSVGVVSPELLPRRQEEALGKALEGFVQAWKQDNPALPH